MKHGILLLAALLAGCSTIEAVTNAVVQVNDTKLDVSERLICNDASAGAIERRYGGNPTAYAGWCKLCGEGRVMCRRP